MYTQNTHVTVLLFVHIFVGQYSKNATNKNNGEVHCIVNPFVGGNSLYVISIIRWFSHSINTHMYFSSNTCIVPPDIKNVFCDSSLSC